GVVVAALEALAEVVVVLVLVDVISVVAVAGVLVGEVVAPVAAPAVDAVGVAGARAHVVAITHGLLEHVGGVAIGVVVTTVADVAIAHRRGVVRIVVGIARRPARLHRLLLAPVPLLVGVLLRTTFVAQCGDALRLGGVARVDVAAIFGLALALQVDAAGALGLAHAAGVVAAREVGAAVGVTLRVALVRFLALADLHRTRRRAHRGNGGERITVMLALDLAARRIALLGIAAGGVALFRLAMCQFTLLGLVLGGRALLRGGLALLRLALLRFAARIVAVVGLLLRGLAVPVVLGLVLLGMVLLAFVLLAFLLVVLAVFGLLRIGLAREGRRRGHAGDQREPDGRGEEGVSMQCHAS